MELIFTIMQIAGAYYLYKNGKKFKDVFIFSSVVQMLSSLVAGNLLELFKSGPLAIVVAIVTLLLGGFLSAKVYEIAYNKAKSVMGYVAWSIVFSVIVTSVLLTILSFVSTLFLV